VALNIAYVIAVIAVILFILSFVMKKA